VQQQHARPVTAPMGDMQATAVGALERFQWPLRRIGYPAQPASLVRSNAALRWLNASMNVVMRCSS
jgi:hypothetical protein